MRIKREFEEKYQPLKAVESKAIDSKREIDLAEAIENLQSARDRLEALKNDSSIFQRVEEEEEELDSEELEDETLIMQTFGPMEAPLTEDPIPETPLTKQDDILKPPVKKLAPPPVVVRKPRLDPKSIGIRPRK